MTSQKPAILGGEKAVTLDHSILRTSVSEEGIISVSNAIGIGKLSQYRLSDVFDSLEEKFKRYHRTRFAVTLNNCTSALMVSYFASGFNQEDEVIIPNYGYTPAILSVAYTRATPVLCAVENKTLSLDPGKLEKLINKNTKGIVITSMWGIPGNIEMIRSIARKYDLMLIEDSARCIGGEVNGKKLGSIGDVGCFSFSTGKALCTGRGGMMITNNESIFKELKILAENHDMHPLSSCMADISFKDLDRRIEQSNGNYEKFCKMLQEFDFIDTLKAEKNTKRGGWSGLAFFYKPEMLRLGVDDFVEALLAEGCMIKREYFSNIINSSDYLRNYFRIFGIDTSQKLDDSEFPVSERIRSNLLICENICSYSSDASEFAKEYREAITKVADSTNAIIRRK